MTDLVVFAAGAAIALAGVALGRRLPDRPPRRQLLQERARAFEVATDTSEISDEARRNAVDYLNAHPVTAIVELGERRREA